MGLFDKFKTIFNKHTNLEEKEEEIKIDDSKEFDKELDKYDAGLDKTRKEFTNKLGLLSKKYRKVSEEYFEELEELLIMADIGVNTVMEFMDKIRKRAKNESIIDTDDLKEIIVDELFIIYVNNDIIVNKINFQEDIPTVLLFVGVNGVGKTTTIGKIAWKLSQEGKKILLVGADTFRAGATEQLALWAEKTNTRIVTGENKDPSSVIYDGIDVALKDKYDVVLIDTAGRLQNKVNLMKELEKINKVIGKLIPNAPHEVLLVIDATTGQNGISQAKSFSEITNITGIVLTKLDGTAKGGIVLAIKNETNIPVKYIGLGEGLDDLQVFDIEKYIYGLFKNLF